MIQALCEIHMEMNCYIYDVIRVVEAAYCVHQPRCIHEVTILFIIVHFRIL